MSNQKYAITEWHDTQDILNRLNNLVKSPLRTIKHEKMEKYLTYFYTKCNKSKALIEKAKQFIPGGVQHNLAFNYPFPLAVKKAEGAYLWDVDGNRYIDFLQAGGPTLLGSNYEPVRQKVIELIENCGPVIGLFHEYELKLAEIINKHMPSVEMFRMLASGTEADMAAIRIARTFTGKRKIIKMGGAYHGWSDQLVYGLHIPWTGSFEAHGIPAGCYADTQEFFSNDVDGLSKLLEKNASEGGTAAVLIEPIGPESGTHPLFKDFNKKVRQLCDKFETLLIFDEVVSGFRMGMGGAQGYFDVKPDLTVFGKIIAGGYPGAGGVGGRRDIMACLASGVEGTKKRAYVGGTLSANPLSCAAGYYTILEIEKTDAAIKAAQAGNKLCAGLQALIDKYELPFVVYNQGSICHLESSGLMFVDIRQPDFMQQIVQRKHMLEKMGAAYMAEGLITLAGSRLYTSMADTDDIIDEALDKFERVFQDI
ncbi:MAG: aminotransferase class III-fold pyridoxal phosphate-dependent enzyme [Tepidanaerobacteraceae bacterium]|nr:aminotransferase class III-fold pyridoxal phosphate-dependent enzyme [Tepidanaerobacteraceae bacterium]